MSRNVCNNKNVKNEILSTIWYKMAGNDNFLKKWKEGPFQGDKYAENKNVAKFVI